MTNNMATMPKPESGAKPAEMATPRNGTFGIPLFTKLFKLHTLCSYLWCLEMLLGIIFHEIMAIHHITLDPMQRLQFVIS